MLNILVCVGLTTVGLFAGIYIGFKEAQYRIAQEKTIKKAFKKEKE